MKAKIFLLVLLVVLSVGLVTAAWTDILSDNLKQYLRLNESAGITAYDALGIYNGTWNTAPATAAGLIGNASFGDGNKYLNTSLKTPNSNFTHVVWFKFSGVQSGGIITSMLATDKDHGYTVQMLDGANQGNLLVDCYDADGNQDIDSITPGVYDDDNWHMVGVTYNVHTTSFNFTIDTTQIDSGVCQIGTGDKYISLLKDGYYGSNEGEGGVDEFGYWNEYFTNDLIEQIYNAGNGLTYIFNDTKPKVTLNTPADAVIAMNDFTLNCSASDDIALVNITLWIDGVQNLTVLNTTTTKTLSLETDLSFAMGLHNWTCSAYDDNKAIGWAATNRTLKASYWEEGTNTYNATVFETATETIILNISYNPTIYSNILATLIYNGTSYTSTKSTDTGTITFSKYLDIPLLTPGVTSEKKQFYWQLALTNATGTSYDNSSFINQTVSLFNFTKCTGTLNSPVNINFTIYNETSRNNITAELDGTFIYWMGTGNIKKNYSYDSSASWINYSFCSNTNNSFKVDSTLKVKADYFYEKMFHFNNQIYNNRTTHTKLFLLDQGSSIIVQVRDSGLVPLDGYSVRIYRYYPEDNSYEIIERAKTDEYGQFVARLIEPNTEKYQFEFLNPSNVVVKRTGDMTIACRTTICVLPFIIEDTTDDFERFENLTEYDWSFEFSETTNTFTFTWADVSGVSAYNRLEVMRYLWNGTTLVCNTTSVLESGSLTCAVGNTSASYQAQVYRKVSGEIEKRIAYLSIKVGEEFRTFGREGLFWSFILLMTMIAIGYYIPPIGILLYTVGIILLWTTKIIYVNPAILISQLVIGIIFIWAFSTRRRS